MVDASASAKKLFINDEQELRSGWRVIAYCLLFFVLVTVIWILVGLMRVLIPALGRLLGQEVSGDETAGSGLVSMGISQSILLVSALGATWVCARILEQRSFGSVGFRLHKGWLRDFGVGGIGGAITLSLAVGIASLAGGSRFWAGGASVSSTLKWCWIPFGLFLISAAWEEAMLRGFPFQALLHNLGPVVAVTITSVIFGILHLGNRDVTAMSTINTVLAGVWLGVAYLKTRSLWLATALHLGWNFSTAFVFGLPVSGITSLSQQPLLSVTAGGPVWLTGGNYGPEGGVAATIALAVSTLVIWKTRLFTASEEMKAATRHGSRRVVSRSTDRGSQP
ncbi:MAG TPA: CPBP family intramembrane glutamic endopeptidase [Blastocatellia bacterium]|nr:CPBP family intramembrane glutamic endopeptidase [Blastocatellia bacterium]